MSVVNTNDKRIVIQDYVEEPDILGKICRDGGRFDSGRSVEIVTRGPSMEAEKRIRREIANSNERRRMQSINAGFQSLRTLLPHHEGEKLSKAAILQQTAEYIYSLEQEKTRLLSQNSQLMRQVHQHEGTDVPPKKRKPELIVPVQLPESSDEGIGSVSPEPVALVSVVGTNQEIQELRRQLERERTMRICLEEQVRTLETQMYHPYPQEVVAEDFKDGMMTIVEEAEDMEMQLISAEILPPVAQTQTVVCSPQVSRSPSPTREPSPTRDNQPRLPSALEAAIKAEPKVEVERLPSPPSQQGDVSPRLYMANTSRQNLETIVEAIRHLEGDHLFQDEPPRPQAPPGPQEAPLALTNKPRDRLLTIEMNPYLRFRNEQQHRPGVIVVKQNS